MLIIVFGLVFLLSGFLIYEGNLKTTSILVGSFLIGFDLSFRLVKWGIKNSFETRKKIKLKINEIEGDRYKMCADQPAQIDCNMTKCKYYKSGGNCLNVSPAITLNHDKTFVCWSEKL